MAEKLRIPCLQDPVTTVCNPDCKNFTYSLQLLRRRAKERDMTPEELADMIPAEADRLANMLAAAQNVPKKMFKRCTEQPNPISFVQSRR